MNVEHMESDEICRALMSWATRFAENKKAARIYPGPGTPPDVWDAERAVIAAAEEWERHYSTQARPEDLPIDGVAERTRMWIAVEKLRAARSAATTGEAGSLEGGMTP